MKSQKKRYINKNNIMKKSILSFDEFILESNTFLLKEDETKSAEPGKAELPKGVLYNPSSRTIKKGTFTVMLGDDGELEISYDGDKKTAKIEFNKQKVSYDNYDKKGEGLARVFSSNTESPSGGKPQIDPKATSGNLLDDFLTYSGQFGDGARAEYMPTLCKILRALSIGEKYKTNTPDSFKNFMAGIYTTFNNDVFASLKSDDKTAKHKDLASKFKNAMTAAIKEMPAKKS